MVCPLLALLLLLPVALPLLNRLLLPLNRLARPQLNPVAWPLQLLVGGLLQPVPPPQLLPVAGPLLQQLVILLQQPLACFQVKSPLAGAATSW